MTGYGEARSQTDGLTVAVDVRTINNRYFKLTTRCSEGYAALETAIENVVRQQIKRGSVLVNLTVTRQPTPDDFRLNLTALASYRRQLEEVCRQWKLSDPVRPEMLLALPGVVDQNLGAAHPAEQDWPRIQETLETALRNLHQMRLDEGRSMAVVLRENCQKMAADLEAIAKRAPEVASGYRVRLEDRLRKALADYQITLNASDLLREVSLFAERCDISEEIVRLRTHIQQFLAALDFPEPSGRKLDFLTQEMFREANTIGSKANDTQITLQVIDIKAAIERNRELIQNVE
jgi:uncharacterized protein (TIGR00255 family)